MGRVWTEKRPKESEIGGEGYALFSGRKKLCKKDFPAMEVGLVIFVESAS